MTPENSLKTTGAVVAELELTINAPRKKVWDAFFNDPHEWWHKDFYASSAPAKFVIDRKLGGFMYEDSGNGSGLIWFTILGLMPGEMVYAIGHVAPPFGGPATGLLTIKFDEVDANTTTFKLSDASFGHLTKNTASNAEAGWKMLFDELKKHVEA